MTSTVEQVHDKYCKTKIKFWHFLKHGGIATCEVIGGRKQGNGLEVPCMYRFVAKQWLIKNLEVLLQPHVATL